MLEEIKASGETLHPDAELFLQNAEMDPKGFTFAEFIEMVNGCYEVRMKPAKCSGCRMPLIDRVQN